MEPYHKKLADALNDAAEKLLAMPQEEFDTLLGKVSAEDCKKYAPLEKLILGDKMEEEKPRIYKDYEDYWRHGKHGCSSFSRDIVEDTWKDLEPTILANRTDWEQLLIAEGKGIYRQHLDALIDWRDYLEEFNLEKVAGINFPKWRMDRLRKKWDKEDKERRDAKSNNDT